MKGETSRFENETTLLSAHRVVTSLEPPAVMPGILFLDERARLGVCKAC